MPLVQLEPKRTPDAYMVVSGTKGVGNTLALLEPNTTRRRATATLSRY